MKDSRAVLRDDSYAHSRLHIHKAISVHFTSFTGLMPRTSSCEVRRQHAVHKECTKKDKTKKIATENKCCEDRGQRERHAQHGNDGLRLIALAHKDK